MIDLQDYAVYKSLVTEEQFVKFVDFINTFKISEVDSKQEFDFISKLKLSLSQETAMSSLCKIIVCGEHGLKSVGYAYLFNDSNFTVLQAKAGTVIGEVLIKERIGEDLLEYVAVGFESDTAEDEAFSFSFANSISKIQKVAEISEVSITQDEIQMELLLVEKLNDLGFEC